MNQQLNHKEINRVEADKEIILIAEGLERPANYGGLIRTAEFFGVKKIIFASNEVRELTSKMKRVSRSAENKIEIAFKNRIEKTIAEYKTLGYKIIALELTDNSIDVNQYKNDNDKIVLICGSENAGVSERVLNLVEDIINIPVVGTTSSLNVVVATGIALNRLSFM